MSNESHSDTTTKPEDILLKHFIDLIQEDDKDVYIDDLFESKKMESNDSADKSIEERNARCQEDDNNSKLRVRKVVTHYLMIMLLLQIIFMNCFVGWLLLSQTTNAPWFEIVSTENLLELSTLAKWYTTATLAELLGVFIYIIKVVYAKLKIT